METHRRALVEVLRRTGGPGRRSEVVPVVTALGRVTTGVLRAPSDLPRFDDSQMDGVAVRAADTPGTLPLGPAVAAGAVPEPLPAGRVAPIMTGAPLPEGADAVVPIEATDLGGFDALAPDTVRVRLPETSPGSFVRRRGSDAAAGEEVLPAGTRLTGAGLGLLASMGLTVVEVLARPRVLVLVGGDEVVPPGTDLPAGAVYDANGTLLTGRLAGLGLEVAAVRLVDDSVEGFVEQVRADLDDCAPDLIVTSGGISAGRYEVVRQGLGTMEEVQTSFGTVAVQPGGPQGLGTVTLPHGGSAAVVCLPGNPVSTWVSCEVLLADSLAEAWGTATSNPWTAARLQTAVRPPAEKDQIRRGRLGPPDEDGAAVAVPFDGTSSHLIAAAARAEILIRIPAGDTELPAGTTVAVRRL